MGKRRPLQHVTIHGHSVGYRRAGSSNAQTILLIHGLAGSSKTWDAVIDELAVDYDVIAPDLLGHGESAKPMQLAYQHPQLTDRLVLVGSGGLGREVSPLLRMLALPGAEYLMPIGIPKPVVERATDVGRFLGRRNIRSERLGELWRAYSSLAGAENRQAFVRTMRGVIEAGGQKVDASDRLYLAARVPMMIVWGDTDGVIPVSHAHRAHRAIENSRLEILEGVGHFPHVEAPDMFVASVLDFMGTTDAGSDDKSLREVLLAHAAEAS